MGSLHVIANNEQRLAVLETVTQSRKHYKFTKDKAVYIFELYELFNFIYLYLVYVIIAGER